MSIFVKSLKLKNVMFVISFLSFFVFLESSVNAAAPTVKNTIPNSIARNGHLFDVVIDTYDTFSDSDHDNLSVTVKQADDSDLPAWLKDEPKQVFDSNIAGVVDTRSAHGITIVDDLVYIGDWANGMRIFDVSDPTNPTEIGTYYWANKNDSSGVAIDGDYAYLCEHHQGFRIIDISNPSSPTLVGENVAIPVWRVVAPGGNYVYAVSNSNDDDTFYVIDVSNPASPTVHGSFALSDAGLGLKVIGNYAYVATFEQGLTIINISDPDTPTVAGSLDTTGRAYDIDVVGNYAYLAEYNEGGNETGSGSGLKIIDISNPANPTLVSTLNEFDSYPINFVRAVTVVGNYAYVDVRHGTNAPSRLYIVDVSDKANPVVLDKCPWSNTITVQVLVRGDYAYAALGNGGLGIMKGVGGGRHLIGTPTQASELGTLNLKATASDGESDVSTTFSISVQNEAPLVDNAISEKVTRVDDQFSTTIST